MRQELKVYLEVVDEADGDVNWPDWVRVISISELGDSTVRISRFLRGPDGSTSAVETVTVQRSAMRFVARFLNATVDEWEWKEDDWTTHEAGVYEEALPAVLAPWPPPPPDYEDDDEPYYPSPEMRDEDIPF